MCGITGIYNFNSEQPDRNTIDAMLRTIAHRGPDGEKIEITQNIAFGHRRLSIIDLEGGTQPMWSSSRSHIIVFNGEIFNYKELREELQTKINLKTSSDTEVILEGIALYGDSFIERLEGQFAFAIYNCNLRELILARDRFGEKPLFFGRFGNSLVFGSELKAVHQFLVQKNISWQFDSDSISHFASLNYVPFHKSFIKGVEEVLPGSFLKVSDGQVSKHSYLHSNLKETGNLDGALTRALSRRLISDVPIGIFLSGGLDSTTVAVTLKKLATNAKAFIAHFPEEGFSEAPKGISVAKTLGIPYEVFEIAPSKEDLPKLIESLVYHGDTPLADSSSLPVYLLSRETAKHVKVVVTGDGGDELFGGYLTYKATALANSIPQSLRKILSLLSPITYLLPYASKKVGLREKLERFLKNISLPPSHAHFAWNGMFNAEEKKSLLHPDVLKNVELLNTFAEMASRYNLNNLNLKSLLLADAESYLVSDILQKVDRMSMAHGLEARPLFLDSEIVSYARALPSNQIISGSETKIPLRRYLSSNAPWYYPGRKEGFSIPIHLWFRTILKEYTHDIFNSKLARTNPLFNQNEILRLWNLHLSKRKNLGFELWGILVGLLWVKQFKRS